MGLEPLTRDAILSRRLRTERVDVPEWGGYVYVRELTIAEVDALGREIKGGEVPLDMRARIVRMAVVDEGGNPVFQPGDEAHLARAGASALIRISNAILSVSGLLDGGIDEEKKGS